MAHALGKNGQGRARSSNGDGGSLRARSKGERAREEELAGANGSGDGDERDRVLLVADQGTSKPSHARHAAPSSAGSPRRHGAAIRTRGRGAGASVRKRASAGGLGRLRPVGQNRGRGLLAPPFLFPFF